MKKARFVAFICLLPLLAGCGANHGNSVLSQLPTNEQQQIDSAMKRGGNFYLPTTIEFTPTHGDAEVTLSRGSRTIIESITLEFYNKSELLLVMEPGDENMTVYNMPHTIHLQDGSAAAFQTSTSSSELSWFDSNGSYSLVSSKIQNGNTRVLHGPDLNQQQLVKIADTVK